MSELVKGPHEIEWLELLGTAVPHDHNWVMDWTENVAYCVVDGCPAGKVTSP